jgi:hypothetical protein
METVKNIKKVSILFFIVIGAVHIGSSMFIANGMYMKQALITNQILDIPFIITGFIYGISSLRISLANREKSHRILDAALAIAVIVIFLALVAINLLIPDITA